jgi:apolipoprotein D and lipocalin family protein
MKAIPTIALFVTAAVCSMFAHAQNARTASSITTIASLDVPRYMGRWYEIAKFPNRFQRDCASNTTATYSILPDGRVKVVNRCRQADGAEKSAEGIARQLGGPASPKLEVRFAPAVLSFIPLVWGDYWVIELDPDYRLAAVSDRKGEYLWILSRTPTVEKTRYDALLARIAAQGLDVTKLEATPHR